MEASDNAVRAAQKAYRECEGDSTESHHAALTAALPFLSVQVAVKVKALDWGKSSVSEQDKAQTVVGSYFISNHAADAHNLMFDNDQITALLSVHASLEAAKSAAQADYEARILSALEPSAPRELALEEVKLERSIERWRGMKPSEVMKGSTAQITYALEDARKDILSLARALSSPDHADAGKVDGDGLPQDVINLVIAAREVWEEADTLSYYHSDEEFSQRVKALDKALEAFSERVPYENEPSAPASEGAE